MVSENPTDDVFVDLNAEGESDLVGNPLAASCAITPFHFNHRVDQVSRRTCSKHTRRRPKPTPMALRNFGARWAQSISRNMTRFIA